MPQAYEVHPYTIAALLRLMAERAGSDSYTIEQKRHRIYLEEYFAHLNTQTIIVEADYTDRDFLEDFAGYYVRCFNEYPRRCTRLHFFDLAFAEINFTALLAAEPSPLTPERLQSAYLGFLVIKPLPQTFIGRTCLRTYSNDPRRFYPITRTYEANLFGLQLTVESLAYQEQDSVAAACATSALWSAFHGTGKQFQHAIPSPVEITRAATAHAALGTRTFPNSNGLRLEQMADAIRSVGLEPYMVGVSDQWVLRSTLYAYLRGQIPVLLGIELYDPDAPVNPNTGRQFPLALHAITAAGYSLEPHIPIVYSNSGFALKAFRMDKIYAHDDQVGPFARMEFLHSAHFSTYHLLGQGTRNAAAFAFFLLIPLYHKIRIPFLSIFNIVSSFSSRIEQLQQGSNLVLSAPLEWDIYLTAVNPLKAELQQMTTLSGEYRRSVLTQPMPRFLWRATALIDDVPVLDLLFDATDIEQGRSFVGVIKHDVVLGQILSQVAQVFVMSGMTYGRPDRHVIEWLAKPAF